MSTGGSNGLACKGKQGSISPDKENECPAGTLSPKAPAFDGKSHGGRPHIQSRFRSSYFRREPRQGTPRLWRSVKSNGRSDLANLSWAKDAVSGRKGACLRSCKYPLKIPTKQGVSRTEIDTHSFKCVWGPRIAGPMMPPQRVRRAARHMWPARLSVHCWEQFAPG